MSTYSRTFIALGSNIDSRVSFLNFAIHQIFKTVGTIISVSKVYQTPAFGFDGTFFYNACIEVDTILSAPQLLEKLKIVEEKSGRIRSKNGYADRPIDLDILFFKDEIYKATDLTIPHTHLHLRDFVLYPMHDICPDFEHPILKKTIDQLKSELPSTKIKVFVFKLSFLA